VEACLSLVSIAIVISTEHLQIFGGRSAAGPKRLSVIYLQMLVAAAHFLREWIFVLAALISLQDMFSHGDVESSF
jgi:hypothetical protein